MSDLKGLKTHRPPRGGLVLAALGLVALAGCQEQQVLPGTAQDITPPVVKINKTQGDTMDVAKGLRFGVSVNDNLGIKDITIDLTGGYAARIDSVYRTAVTSANL